MTSLANHGVSPLEDANTSDRRPLWHEYLIHYYSRPKRRYLLEMSSFLRRRIFDRPTSDASKSQTTSENAPQAEEVRLAPVSKIISDGNSIRGKRRTSTLIFMLGGFFGLLMAGFFAKHNDLIEFPELSEFSMDSLLDVLPSGFVKDARDLAVRLCAVQQWYQLILEIER